MDRIRAIAIVTGEEQKNLNLTDSPLSLQSPSRYDEHNIAMIHFVATNMEATSKEK
jgi:hypothetical protein